MNVDCIHVPVYDIQGLCIPNSKNGNISLGIFLSGILSALCMLLLHLLHWTCHAHPWPEPFLVPYPFHFLLLQLWSSWLCWLLHSAWRAAQSSCSCVPSVAAHYIMQSILMWSRSPTWNATINLITSSFCGNIVKCEFTHSGNWRGKERGRDLHHTPLRLLCSLNVKWVSESAVKQEK